MLLEKLTSPLVRCNPRIVQTVTRILPFLTYGQRRICEVLIQYFTPYLEFEAYDGKEFDDPLHTLHLECFVNVSRSIPLDLTGARLKDLLFAEGVSGKLVEYLDRLVSPMADSPKESDEWQERLARASLPYVLQSLAGVCEGHEATQALVLERPAMVRALYQMTEISTKKKIGNDAEQLLRSVEFNNAAAATAIEAVREAAREAKRAKANEHRKQMLQGLGMKVSESGKITAASAAAAAFMELDDEEEDDGLVCKVCKEGYAYLPTELLGFYTYTKRVPLVARAEPSATTAALASGRYNSNTDTAYASVTNFNLTHWSCHREAARADANLKPRKEEWEGAALRNASTLCNNIFPLFGPSITEDTYVQALERYWSTQASNCGRIESTRFRLLAHDMRLLLLRYAYEQSFSSDSKGGGRESNIRLLPYYLQMGLFLLDQTAATQRRVYEQKLSEFLALSRDACFASAYTVDNVLYFLVLTLFLHTREEWEHYKLRYLERALVYATVEARELLANATAAAASTSDAASAAAAAVPTGILPSENLRPYRAVLLFFTLITKLHQLFKKPSTLPVATDEPPSINHAPTEQWLVDLKAYLRNSDAQYGEQVKELCSEYESMWVYIDNVQEFIEEIGMLVACLVGSWQLSYLTH